MKRWSGIETTAGRRPVLGPDERDIAIANGIGLYDGRIKVPGYQKGRAYLTTRRICYVSEDITSRAIGISLNDIKSIDIYAGFLRSSPKITLITGEVGGNNIGQDDSGASTPRQERVPMSWVCPICYFSNELPRDYQQGTSSLPTCATCGVKASKETIEQAITANDVKNTDDSNSANSMGSISSGDPVSGFACPRCTFLNHPSLYTCEVCGANLVSQNLPPKLNVYRSTSPEPFIPFITDQESQEQSSSAADYVKLSFRAGGERQFYERLKGALAAREWDQDSNNNNNKMPSEPASLQKDKSTSQAMATNGSRLLGIRGVERLDLKEREMNEQVLGDSFQDLEALTARGKEVVKLAEQIAKSLSGARGLAPEARAVLMRHSQSMGLSSPIVTKEIAAGGKTDVYIEELARQVAEFLESSGLLKKEGGTVTLIDLFAFYNRARGIALVSPNELKTACEQFERLNLPVRLRTFKSGLMAVQDGSQGDSYRLKQIEQWITELGQDEEHHHRLVGVTVEEASHRFGWSLGIASEELSMAEEAGRLCRDVVIESTRFYLNKFEEFRKEINV